MIDPAPAPRGLRRREAPLRVVALGGGHGLAATLRALRLVTHDVTAVVTVADDGGSSGRLRQELGVLPPGDLRMRSEEHTSELQSRGHLVCRLLLEKKKSVLGTLLCPFR